jgi:hypothetical protein
MKSILTALTLLLLCAGQVLAEVRPIESQLKVIELVDSRRTGWKNRHHFWQFRGVKEYTYKTKENSLIVSEIHDKSVPDKRTWEKRHPLMGAAQTAGSLVGVAANAAGLLRH